MSVADRLNKLTTDITNAYTSIENKGGTIPANKNTNNLSTAINSIEVIETATAEGESLSLANTKAMPYSDYVVKGKSEQSGEPSPSIPSEIHSVGDDVNLFDETFRQGNQNSTQVSGRIFSLPSDWLIKNGDVFIFSTNLDTSIYSYAFYIAEKPFMSSNNNFYYNSGYQTTKTFVVNSLYNGYFGFTIRKNDETNINPNDIKQFNFKIQKGTVATPYSPYNQGTVTIKQRGKNLFDYNYVKDYNNTTLSAYRFIQIKDFENTNRYLMSGINTSEFDNVSGVYIFLANSPQYSGLMMRYALCSNSNQITNNKYVIQYTDTNELYIGIALSQGSVTEEIYNKIIDKFENVQLEKMISGDTPTPYEPYQANDYTIQTEPLRSLPNGVKDTIEEDGIHRRVGRVILDGSEDENWQGNGGNALYGEYVIDIGKKPNVSVIAEDNMVCNRFTKNLINNNRIVGRTNNNNLYVDLSINIVEYNLSNFKTWLSNNPIEVLYELAEAVTEPLTQNQATTMLDIIKTGSYEGTTNIYTDEDVKPTIGVGYYKKS